MKSRRIAILATLAVILGVVVLAVAAAAFVLQPGPVAWAGKGKSLGKDQVISGQAVALAYGVGKGDTFPFLLEVLYDSDQIAGIDRASLDQAVSAKPFEIRSYKESEFAMDARVRVYRREYEFQFVDGKLDQTYELPTIVVRYQLKNANGYAEKAIVPAPIRVASRLPAEIEDLELRPITDKVQDPSRDRLTGVLLAGGALLLVLCAADLVWRVIPRWREESRQRRQRQSGDVLVQAFRSLNQQMASKADPKVLLHQVDHILRLVLAQKGQVNWLEELDLSQVPAEIRPALSSLYATCEQAYGMSRNGAPDMAQTVRQLDQVLGFYYGSKEVEAWRN